jgi:hypothetical protein
MSCPDEVFGNCTVVLRHSWGRDRRWLTWSAPERVDRCSMIAQMDVVVCVRLGELQRYERWTAGCLTMPPGPLSGGVQGLCQLHPVQ